MRPTTDPIGLAVTRTGRVLSRAFDDELSAAGASLPVWLVVATLKQGEHTMQREIAAAIGIEGATLTHHLNRMEASGLITRERAPGNRRTQVVALTAAGEALFTELLAVVVAFDGRLREGFSERELGSLHGMLERLRANASL